MRHFLSHLVAKFRSLATIQFACRTRFIAKSSASPSGMFRVAAARKLCLCLCLTLLVCAMASPSRAQVPFPTSRADNSRSNANTNETLLTPINVNKNSFGHLFSVPIDPGATPMSTVLAQPLFMPNVNIPNQGIHNVVYVVTMTDSVYAIDADNGAQLWYASMLDG